MLARLAHAALALTVTVSTAAAGPNRKPNAYERSHQKELKSRYKRELGATCLNAVLLVSGVLMCAAGDPAHGKQVFDAGKAGARTIHETQIQRAEQRKQAARQRTREKAATFGRPPRTLQRDTARKQKAFDAKNAKAGKRR